MSTFLSGRSLNQRRTKKQGELPCAGRRKRCAPRHGRFHRFAHPFRVEQGWLSGVKDTLQGAVLARENILIAGGTGSGKSTLTKALIDLIPRHERLEVIEDTRELKIDHVDVVQCEAQREQRDPEGRIAVPARTIRDLVKASLRDNPDRIIIGEVRGAEAFDLLDSANTGHTGAISTLHANSAFDALGRLETMAGYADVNLSHRGIQARIGSFINLIVHVKKVEQRRFVSEVIRVNGFDADAGRYDTTVLFES